MAEATNSKTQRVLTGDRPTGPLHLGHMAGSLLNRVKLQDDGVESFIMIADAQAYTDNIGNPGAVREAVRHLVSDYLAVGIDPDRSCIFLQSAVPELFELTAIYLNLVSVSRLERNPTIRAEIKQKGFERSLPAGFLCYPASQAADITGFKATHVPVGEDQLPMIELAQEIARKLNVASGRDFIPMPQAILSRTPRLPGTDGKEKASKSLGNAIYIGDTADEVRRKVMSMFTDPNHLRVEDPGVVEGNAVFAYLDAFDDDKKGLEELKAHYRRGGLGDVTLKKRLVSVLERVLSAPRAEREIAFRDDTLYKDILIRGSDRARSVVADNLSEVKRGLGLLTI